MRSRTIAGRHRAAGRRPSINRYLRFLAAAAAFGGAGRYSTWTLLTRAMGRPGALKSSMPSTRTTESFSPRTLTCIASAGRAIATDSIPVGATAFKPPGPLPPEPYPKSRTPQQWNAFLDQLFQGWGGHWENPEA